MDLLAVLGGHELNDVTQLWKASNQYSATFYMDLLAVLGGHELYDFTQS